jgi:hypothetical protein
VLDCAASERGVSASPVGEKGSRHPFSALHYVVDGLEVD